MGKPMELYKLRTLADHSEYKCFGLDNSKSLLGRYDFFEDISPGYGADENNRVWAQINLSDVWRAPLVDGEVNSYHDYPCLNFVFPTFSKKAVEVLRDLLVPNGEVLELNSNVGEYFFYNITKVVDALNVDKSRCEFWCSPPTTALKIDYYSFYADKIEGLSIFRIMEDPSGVIVSGEFKDRILQGGLKGFEFFKIWPIGVDENWRNSESIKAK